MELNLAHEFFIQKILNNIENSSKSTQRNPRRPSERRFIYRAFRQVDKLVANKITRLKWIAWFILSNRRVCTSLCTCQKALYPEAYCSTWRDIRTYCHHTPWPKKQHELLKIKVKLPNIDITWKSDFWVYKSWYFSSI